MTREVISVKSKMKSCCSPHALTHSLMGVGVGLLVATTVESARLVWLGILLIVIGFVFDILRKKAGACCGDECGCCSDDKSCDESKHKEEKCCGDKNDKGAKSA